MTRRRTPEAKVVPIGGPKLLARLRGDPAEKYVLRLYVAGTNLNSVRAIENVRRLCKALRPTRCDLEIIDLYQQPGLAKRDDVVAAPALVKISPPPTRTFVGDLSDMERIVIGLGIVAANKDVRTKSAGE